MSTIPAHKEKRVIRKGGRKIIEKPAKRKAKEVKEDESASQK